MARGGAFGALGALGALFAVFDTRILKKKDKKKQKTTQPQPQTWAALPGKKATNLQAAARGN